MERKFCMLPAYISILLLCILFFTLSGSGKLGMQKLQPAAYAAEEHTEYTLEGRDEDPSLEKYYIKTGREGFGFEAETEMPQVRRAKLGFFWTAALFQIYVLTMQKLFSWNTRKRAFLAFLNAYLYHMARFLRDLVINQEKDGKKRIPKAASRI